MLLKELCNFSQSLQANQRDVFIKVCMPMFQYKPHNYLSDLDEMFLTKLLKDANTMVTIILQISDAISSIRLSIELFCDLVYCLVGPLSL